MRRDALLAMLLLAGCRNALDDLDGAFYSWDNRRVHCAVEIDDDAGFADDEIFAGLDRARDRGEVVELLAHIPGVTVPIARIETVLAAARDRNLPFLTITELLAGPPRAGVALMYDDWHTAEWVTTLDLLAQYNAHITLYVGRYPYFDDKTKNELRMMADAGHDVEAHSILHRRGPELVEAVGLRSYLDDEALPSIDLLRADGYDVVSYAYPFGAHTDEMDAAILASGRVRVVRSLAKPNELRANPCRD